MSKVTVYTLPSCVQCDSTKRYLSRNFIEYEEVKLHENPLALEMIKEMGFTAAPVVVAGEKKWSGFRLDELEVLKAA
jgi:glutaredoxin-like protein NrdH